MWFKFSLIWALTWQNFWLLQILIVSTPVQFIVLAHINDNENADNDKDNDWKRTRKFIKIVFFTTPILSLYFRVLKSNMLIMDVDRMTIFTIGGNFEKLWHFSIWPPFWPWPTFEIHFLTLLSTVTKASPLDTPWKYAYR